MEIALRANKEAIILESVGVNSNLTSYLVILIIIGLAALGMAWMSAFTKRTGISYALLYMVLGMLLYLTAGHPLTLAGSYLPQQLYATLNRAGSVGIAHGLGAQNRHAVFGIAVAGTVKAG
jgi:hypothetical protein